MRANGVWAVVLTALLASQLAGCSWALTEAPPPQAVPESELECTTSRRAPVIDTVAASSMAVTAIVYFIVGLQKSTPETSRGTYVAVGIGGVLGAGVVGLSARTGFKRTRACRRAHQAALTYSPMETESGKPLDHAADRPSENDLDK